VAGGRILIVDDDHVLRASISRILEEEGYAVDDAADGAAALDKVTADPPDAILLDVMMPGMNGREFLTRLRKSGATSIPVVVMTALQGLGTDRALDYGANDFVEKPFDVDELLNKVALALYRSGERDNPVARPGSPRFARASTDGDAPPRPGAARAAATPREAGAGHEQPTGGIVLVLDQDQDTLSWLDALLDARGYTAVALSRLTPEFLRLARVLEPRGVVLGLRADAAGLDALRRLRREPELGAIPALVLADEPARLEAHQAEITRLGAAAAVASGDDAERRLVAFLVAAGER
jgi:DNA-binding response OmpR family regulator